MGLLKRLRASSSATARPEQLDPAPPVPSHPTAPLYASSSRLSLASPRPTPTPSPAKQSKAFWKRKDKGNEREVQGLPYESTAPSSFSIDRTQSHQSPHGYSQPMRLTQSRPDGPVYQNGHAPEVGKWDEAGMQTPRPLQHTPKGILKTRGMLGKLEFEKEDSSTDEERLDAKVTQQGRSPSGAPQPPNQPYGGQRPSTTIGRDYDHRSIDERDGAVRVSQEEPMERLISPEKKPAWTPGARRMSRSSEPDEPSSPTPRKSSLPPQDLGTPTGANKAASSDGPQSNRRPSSSRRSSFIPIGNPFARSTTRLSLSNDQNVDDGSFQLRSFRHVSGASEADFAGWETYNQPEAPKASAAVVTSPVSAGASLSRPASTAPPSRPVSRATSLASMDDHIAASTKVSAAAFRKGIRRPSESAITSMEDDDDDDVPLGMLRPGARQSSALSLNSMREMKGAMASPARSPARQAPDSSLELPVTPSKVKSTPAASPAAETPNRIRPTRSRTKPLISPDEIHPIFASPSGSPTGEKQKEPPEADGYFGTTAGKSSGEAVAADAESPPFDFTSLDYPIEAISTSPGAPKLVKSEATPALGPPVDISPPTSKFGKLSISVPEPRDGLRVNGDNPAGLDGDMVVRSMAMYGPDDESDEPPTPRMALHQQSHSTLFGTDASSDTTSTIRSPLSERLGNLVGPRPMSSKPSLPKLDTLRLEDGGDRGERVRSPAHSDSTVSPTVSTIRDFQPAVSSFARVNGRADLGGSAEDSSSEEDEEVPPPPKRPDGPPRSSFTNAPRPRTILSNKASESSQSSNAFRTSSNDASSSSDDEDEDKPLARIKSKASRSTLPREQAVASPQSAKAPTPSSPAIPARANHTRRASVPAVIGPDPTAAALKVNGSPTKRIWNASPASSQSGLTGDSSAVQPITPSENDMSEGRSFKAAPPVATQQASWSDPKRASVSWAPEHRQRRDSHLSVATAPPASAARTHEQAPPVPPMPLGANPMDPVMRQRMKEMWQAQYMAAASRAFEDEWERQSNVSGATSSMPQPQYPGYAMPHSPHGQYPMPPQMPYGYPPMQPQMAQYMYPGWSIPPPQPEPSMYAYGAGAQSVYGGEFGPPQPHPHAPMPMSPYNRPMSMGFPQSYSTTNLHQPYDQRPSMPTSRSTSYFQPTHSSGRRERAPADGLDYTPPPKGLIHSVPNSPRGANRRSHLGTSVINATDRSTSAGAGPPPTSWRRSAVPLLEWDEEDTPKKRRPGQIVN